MEIAREQRLHELKNRDRRDIGTTIINAGRPVTEANVDGEGNEMATTKTPDRTEQLAAGERRAMELGDFEAADHIRKLSAPKLTKLGQDETIVNERGEVIFANPAGAERRGKELERKHELDVDRDKKKANEEHRLRLHLEHFKMKNGGEKTTAMVNNINFMVENGISEDAKTAFEMLRTTMSKPDDQAVLDLSKSLLRGPGYRGKDGQQRALDDATDMVGRLRGARSTQGTFSSAEDVRSAFKSGNITRDAAVRELRRFGYTD